MSNKTHNRADKPPSLTLRVAAKTYGYHSRWLFQLVSKGKLEAWRDPIDPVRQWFVTVRAMDELAAKRDRRLGKNIVTS